MRPFERHHIEPPDVAKFRDAEALSAALASYDKHREWRRQGLYDFVGNDDYVVHVYRGAAVLCASPANIGADDDSNPFRYWPEMIWLSIRRRDRAPVTSWRDLQTIKDTLVGPDHEAVQLFPKDSRLVDTANQTHLWVLAEPGMCFPFGYTEREVLTPEEASRTGATQAPRNVSTNDGRGQEGAS